MLRSRYLWLTDFNSMVIFLSLVTTSARPKPVMLFIIVFLSLSVLLVSLYVFLIWFTYRFIIVHYRIVVKHFFVDGGMKCVVYYLERTQDKINGLGRGFGS